MDLVKKISCAILLGVYATGSVSKTQVGILLAVLILQVTYLLVLRPFRDRVYPPAFASCEILEHEPLRKGNAHMIT